MLRTTYLGIVTAALLGCDGSDAGTSGDASTRSDVTPAACGAGGAVDLLVVVDDSGSMGWNQHVLAQDFGRLLDALTSASAGAPAARSVHVGVVSSDLGSPGTQLVDCDDGPGNDGRLNPIRNGPTTLRRRAWASQPPGRRPARCTLDPDQFPGFLEFDVTSTDRDVFAEDFACVELLGSFGCGIEQQLEAVRRALVTHDPRVRPGNLDVNAGFLRDDAVLAVLMFTDEEDGSVRDCRYAEPGVPCVDATSAFDYTASGWASSDLNLRTYLYTPGSSQDPTWPVDRYVDPTHAGRGFTSLKPGRPELVVFGAITGVPIELPSTGGRVDWDALLGRNPDGSDGYVGTSPEGPISMRQRNPDPACSIRVVPACHREGTPPTTACDPAVRYHASPSRRVAQVVRRFDEAWGNGTIASICRNDYGAALDDFAAHIRRRLCR